MKPRTGELIGEMMMAFGGALLVVLVMVAIWACVRHLRAAKLQPMSTHGIRGDRVTLSVSADQQVWLNELALQRGVSVSDILRRLIDETRGAYITPAHARVDLRASRELVNQEQN